VFNYFSLGLIGVYPFNHENVEYFFDYQRKYPIPATPYYDLIHGQQNWENNPTLFRVLFVSGTSWNLKLYNFGNKTEHGLSLKEFSPSSKFKLQK